MATPLKENDPGIPEQSDRSERSYSADVPTYDTYPAEPPRTQGWRPADRQATVRNPRLEESAERIGSFVGDAVNRGRDAVRRLDSMKQDARRTSQSKVQEITDRANEKWSNARAAAQEKFEDLRDNAQERLENWRDAARESASNAKEVLVDKTREARIRARDYTNRNPHHILLGIAGLAFAIGLTARIMRGTRD